VTRFAHLYGRVARWGTAHPRWVDVAFASAIGACTVAGFLTATPEGSQRDADVWGVLLIFMQAAAFCFRRRAPLAAFAALSVPVMVFWVADYATNFDAISLLGAYAATAHSHRPRRVVWTVVGAIVAVLTTIAIAGVLSPREDLPLVAVFGIAAVHVTAAVVGEVMHDRRLRLLELEERAVRAEAERELLAREAVLHERASIARDLHDVVAHGMSVMVVQAGAAQRLLASDPERAMTALEHVQATGREALAEMRRMLGVLRGDDGVAALVPQPNLDHLASMVQRCNDAGVPTDLTIEGSPPVRAAGVEMAAYRIVQEALTNVVKHAGRPVRATVRVRYTPEDVRLEVDDDGRGATDRQVATSTGHGLIGMRERVELYRGTVHAGPRPGGGFRVAATIPLAAGPTTGPRPRPAHESQVSTP
jgi:signal transduction histidine kinase